MKHREQAVRLLRKADQDLIVLQKWRTDPDIADELLGFHAQQAAEKMLKAVLAHQQVEFPLTHRLADLIDLLTDHGIAFPDDLDEVRYLTPFAVEFRYDFYPAEAEEPFDVEAAFTLLKRLRAWVDNIIRS